MFHFLNVCDTSLGICFKCFFFYNFFVILIVNDGVYGFKFVFLDKNQYFKER